MGRRYIIGLILVLLLAGCSTFKEIMPEEESKNACPSCPVCEPEKVPIKETITKYVNVTTPCNCTPLNNNCTITTLVYETNSSYVLNLIRQLKWCEKNCDYNGTFYQDKFEDCNRSLSKIMEALK